MTTPTVIYVQSDRPSCTAVRAINDLADWLIIVHRERGGDANSISSGGSDATNSTRNHDHSD